MRRKCVSMLLAIVMALALLPGTALAMEEGDRAEWVMDGEDIAYPVTGGNIYISHYDSYKSKEGDFYYSKEDVYFISDCDDSVTEVNISGQVDGYTIEGIGWKAFDGCADLTSVSLPASLAYIGVGAFENCTALVSITLPASLLHIGNRAFANCESLDSIVLPTSLTNIGNYAFFGCISLTDVTLPDSLISIGYSAFYNCGSLIGVTFPDSLVSIGDYAFAYCDSLVDVMFPDSLTSIDDYAFAYCDNLVGATLPDSLTSIGDCAFAYCTGLTGVTLPGALASLGDGTFQGLTDLTTITIPAGLTEIVGNPFSACPNLKEIVVAAGNPKYTAENGVLFNKDKTAIVAYPTADTAGAYSIPDGVKSIGIWAFQETGLASVTIPASVTTIGEGAFYDCDSLKDVYYAGTEAQWKAIEIDHNEEYIDSENYEDYNAPLMNAAIHYNSTGPDADDTSTTPSTPSTTAPSFTDVKPGAYYAAPVAWAVEQEITSGTGNGQFSPSRTCNVSEILTFLWRAAGKPEPTVENPFTDVKESSFYYKPALWAYEKGMVTGSTFGPSAVCTRAMAVTFIWQASDSPAADPASFTDVPADSSYAAAVAWAVANGVTEGVGNGQFDPSGTCTRGQIVTFLYRAFAE